MNPVEWLQNLLHSIDLKWVLIILSWLIGLFWIMCLMKARAWSDRRAEYYHSLVVGEINRGMQQANSVGPQVTAKTLMEEGDANAR